MDPENVSMIGFAVLLIGFILTLGGMLFLGQVYSCGLSIGTSCPADVAARFDWAFPLMIFRGVAVRPHAIATAARPTESGAKSAGVEARTVTRKSSRMNQASRFRTIKPTK